MGSKTLKRLLVLCLTVVMMLASSMTVLATTADTSPSGGETEAKPVVVKTSSTSKVNKKYLKVYVSAKNSESYIFRYKLQSQSWTKAKTIKSTVKNATLQNLTKGGLYDIQVAGVKNGVQGSWSSTIRRLYNKTAFTMTSSSGKLVVNLPKTKGAYGYYIRYATKADLSNGKTVGQTAKATRRTIKGLKKGTTYYVRVTPYYKTKTGKWYMGEMTTKKITVK